MLTTLIIVIALIKLVALRIRIRSSKNGKGKNDRVQGVEETDSYRFPDSSAFEGESLTLSES